jgi:hypothetical protein
MYGNYNNYYLDYLNRQAAQTNFMDAMEAGRRAQEANAAYDRNANMAPGFMGSRSPLSSAGHMAYNHAGRFWGQHENNYANMGGMAMQNALANENARVQDRTADYYENQVASKNKSDYMRYLVEMDKQKKGYDLGMAQNNALANMQANMDVNFGGGDQGMPSTTLYDNDGKKIGGSVPSSGSLFEKTGIKKSLMA